MSPLYIYLIGKLLFVPVMAVPTEQTINSRKPLLNEYLEKLVANGSHLSSITYCISLNHTYKRFVFVTEHICKQPIFLSFLDVARRGVPGSVKLLGRENIIFELMTKTNRPTFYIDLYPFWGKDIIHVESLFLCVHVYYSYLQVSSILFLRRLARCIYLLRCMILLIKPSWY